MVGCLEAFDLRFKEASEEADFKASLEPQLITWMLIGIAVACTCTTFHTLISFGPVFYGEHLSERLFNFAAIKSRVFFCQTFLWAFVPAACGLLISLRKVRGWFQRLNVELVVAGIMVYGSVIIVYGQTYYLTLMFGEDPAEVWSPKVSCSVEAWVLVGLNTMTTAAMFYLPIRSVVSWVVPCAGLVAYCSVKAWDPEAADLELLMRTIILAALSYLAWHGSSQMEKHIRTEWRALEEVKRSACTIEEQQVSIQTKDGQIQEKEAMIKETTELAKSLHTVTRALCDTMIHLTCDMRVSLTDRTNDVFFEEHVEGRFFTEMLTADDQARFMACVSRASMSHIPECIPVTLHRKYTTSEVHLLLVDRGGGSPRYLLGIRVERDHPPARQATLEGLAAGGCGNRQPQQLQPLLQQDAPAINIPGQIAGGDAPPGGTPARPVARAVTPPGAAEGGFAGVVPQAPAGPAAAAPAAAPAPAALPTPARLAPSPSAVPHPRMAPPGGSSGQHVASPSGPRPRAANDEDNASDFSFTTFPRNRPPPRHFFTTSVRARARTIHMILRRWCVPRDNTSCCHYHTVLESIDEAIDYLAQEVCDPLFSSFREQCTRCGCMNHSLKCVVCGFAGAPTQELS